MRGLRLAFGYKARTGKSSAVEYLKHTRGGVEYAFSEPVYDILSYAQKTCGFKIEKDRSFLQFVGTDWGREKNPDVWLNILISKIHSTSFEKNIYISDVRFPNEFYGLKNLGFKMILVNRNDAILDRSFGSGSRSHLSEMSLEDIHQTEWDCVIENNKTLQDFFSNIDKTADFFELEQI